LAPNYSRTEAQKKDLLSFTFSDVLIIKFLVLKNVKHSSMLIQSKFLTEYSLVKKLMFSALKNMAKHGIK
jgi:hypothetical protein